MILNRKENRLVVQNQQNESCCSHLFTNAFMVKSSVQSTQTFKENLALITISILPTCQQLTGCPFWVTWHTQLYTVQNAENCSISPIAA